MHKNSQFGNSQGERNVRVADSKQINMSFYELNDCIFLLDFHNTNLKETPNENEAKLVS